MSESSESGYDEEEGSISLALHNAAEAGDVHTLERLLGLSEEAGVGLPLGALFRRLVNGTDRNECTPLHLAIIHAHPACVAALLRAHASPAKPCDGAPPLALAACLGLSSAADRAAAGLEIVRTLLAGGADPYDKDDGGRTALHWAACSGRIPLVALLLAGAADVQRSRVAAMAADAAALAAATADGGATIMLPALERPEHVLAAADHDGFNPLHLAAKFGHAEVVTQLLRAAEEAGVAAAAATGEELARAEAAAAEGRAASATEGGGSEASAAAPPPPAGKPPNAAALAALLPVSEPASLLRAKTRQEGHTALHLAAMYGRTAAALELLRGLAAAGAGGVIGGGQALLMGALAAADKKGRTAADLARRRGHLALADLLAEAAAGRAVPSPPPPASAAAAAATIAAYDPAPRRHKTLLLAPDECLLHRTAPEPIERSDAEPPPENVNRLYTLTRPVTGILHNTEFAELEWRTSGVPQADMVDVLRCHDWSYVRRVIQACEAISDDPSSVGSLDHDTAISRHTWRAALGAAGAVCTAVDDVVMGRARNAFCAIRPPGHHAGPCGIVTNPNDSHGSHGFCILSNAAIGAAYAMAVHRHAGIRRVAIVDFDVHHGNGTQACVLNTTPSIRTLSLRTPYSDGQQHFPVYKPWLGDGDAHNIFFASVQGFGRRGSVGGWFYPGSGATADSAIAPSLKPSPPPPTAAAAADGALSPVAGTSGGGAAVTESTAATAAAAGLSAAAAAAAAAGPAAGNGCIDAAVCGGAGGSGVGDDDDGSVLEDPDGEFRGSYDVTVVGGPRVINVGIPGPGGKPRMWRRAWRDKILPALMNFKPDIILVSAGFDAHKKEDLNLRYVGITEADYEWVTSQIVEVANACCGGKLVSVLEGGYNLRGGPLGSAFARSVAAHVRALLAPCTAKYDPTDAETERIAEKALEARKAAKAAALASGIIPPAGLVTPRSSVPTPRAFPPVTATYTAAAAAPSGNAPGAFADGDGSGGGAAAGPMVTDAGAAGAAADAAAAGAAAAAAGTEEPPAKRRRRPVDYAALNAQMEKEQQDAMAAAKAATAAADGGSGGDGDGAAAAVGGAG